MSFIITTGIDLLITTGIINQIISITGNINMSLALDLIQAQQEDDAKARLDFSMLLVKELYEEGSSSYRVNGQDLTFDFDTVIQDGQPQIDNKLAELCRAKDRDDVGFIQTAIDLCDLISEQAKNSAVQISNEVKISDQIQARS